MAVADEEHKEKKKRKRMKKLLNSTKTQLEFYFSDANLRHDRFLRKEIDDSPDGYVELTMMLKFNKLKALASDTSILVKAIDSSNLLQLNEEKTKVKRVNSIPTEDNVDSKTVYVEQLPSTVDHDWLTKTFSTCGMVDYVSLPRYKHNNAVKGFAFIEFATTEAADKACKQLNSVLDAKKKKRKPQRESIDVLRIEPDKSAKRRRSRSISESSDNTDKKSKTRKRRRSESLVETKMSVKNDENEKTPKKKKKRKSNSTDSKIDDKKKDVEKGDEVEDNLETVTKENDKNENKENSSESSKKKKRKKSKDECTTPIKKSEDKVKHVEIDNEIKESNTVEKEKKDKVKQEGSDCEGRGVEDLASKNEEEVKGDEKSKKKNRKHKRKNKDIDTPPPLYVISKAKWLEMKKEYKQLQKKNFSEIKSKRRLLESEKVRRVELKQRIFETIKQKQENANQNASFKHNNQTKFSTDEKSTNGSSVENNFAQTTNDVRKEDVVPKLDINIGTVVSLKIKCEQIKRNELKTLLLPHGVAYVDYADGSPQGFIRFKTKEDVDKLMKKEDPISDTFTLTPLEEQAERDYFKKAEEDKRKNYSQNEKKKKKKERGSEKLAKKIDGY